MSSSSKLLGMFGTYGVAGTFLSLSIVGLIYYLPMTYFFLEGFWKEKNYWMFALGLYYALVMFLAIIFGFYWAWLKW